MALRSIKRTFARNRNALDPSVPKIVTTAVINEIEATAEDTILITFGERVQANKTPGFTAGADGTETVATVTRISETQFELSFTGAVAGTDMVVKGGDPGIRTPSGGFVPAGSYAIPTFP